MLPEIIQEVTEVLQAPNTFPSVSIIIPFEPKMTSRKELEHQLSKVLEKAEAELAIAGSPDSDEVLGKIHKLIDGLNYNTYKKSVALYASPLMEKTYYLDIPVEEKIIIDSSFEIRDLVYSKKDIHKYLVLVLNTRHSKIFLGNTTQFIRILCNTPVSTGALDRDLPGKVSNFTTSGDMKEIMLDKFLHHVDTGLGIILTAYDLPLFIMGPEKVTGHFKKISHHTQRITGIITGNFEESTEAGIREAVAPRVKNWKAVKQADLIHHLEEAVSFSKLSKGMRDVWKAASEKRGRLLVVEKNFICPARFGNTADEINPDNNENDLHPLIRDAVDDVIEKVLAGGGDVEFVDPGILNGYEHIALIRNY